MRDRPLSGAGDCANGREELGESGTDQAPNQSVVDVGVAVDQDVPKRDQTAILGYPIGECRVAPGELGDGLADYFKFPLNACP